MTISDRTIAVVKTWAQLNAEPQLTEPLQSIGANLAEPFYPDACQTLVRRLIAAFPEGKHLNQDLQYTQICDSVLNPNGTVLTLSDLIGTIEASLTTPVQKFMSLISAPLRFIATKVRGR